MDALTPASADDLPPLGELIVDDPFWAYPASAARQGVAHLRVWATAGPEPGYLAVITETGGVASVTESAGRIWAVLAGRFGPSLVLLEHDLAPESGEGIQTLDLVRAGPDGSPHRSRVWPTSQENPRHAGLEWWMAAHGYQIVSRTASEFDWCEDEGGVLLSGLGMAGRGRRDPHSALVPIEQVEDMARASHLDLPLLERPAAVLAGCQPAAKPAVPGCFRLAEF